jgi:hypothetical protein
MATSERIRDPRRNERIFGIKSLLVSALAQLEELLTRTPKDDALHARIRHRLAEDYVLLEAYAEREEASAAANRDRLRAELLGSAARAYAILHYSALIDEHPTYGRIDEAMYYAGYEREQGGDWAEPERLYTEILTRRPPSRFTALARLALAEHVFEVAKVDPFERAVARASYERVLASAGAEESVRAYAIYKLAHLDWTSGAQAGALGRLEQVLSISTGRDAKPPFAMLSAAARRDLEAAAEIFAWAGRGKAAADVYARLERWAGDAAARCVYERKRGEALNSSGGKGP